MTPDKAIAILKKHGVPTPYVERHVVYHEDEKPKEYWHVCSYGHDSHCVNLLGAGPTVLDAMRMWYASQPSFFKTRRAKEPL